MLGKKKITVSADTVVGDVKIATHAAILDVEDNDLSLYTRHIDKEACKTHKEIVRADRAEFEDFAYTLQETYCK
jgi:hypothetical protein